MEPGLTRTELGDHLDNAELSQQLSGMFDQIEALTAEDVADLIGYVASRPPHVLVLIPTTQS